MYTPTVSYLDDYSLALLGFAVLPPAEGIAVTRDAIDREYGTVAIADRDGVELTATSPKRTQRAFTLSGILTADSGSALRARYDELIYRAAGDRERRIRLVDDSSREIKALFLGGSFTYLGFRIPEAQARVDLRWLAKDPAWRNTSDTVVALSTVGAACALGSEKSWPVIVINGACTNPVIEYRTNAGALIASLTLTIALSGGQTAIVDMDARWVKNAAGVITPSLRTAGTYFPLDPYVDDALTGVFGKLSLTATSGTPTGSATYRKRWAA